RRVCFENESVVLAIGRERFLKSSPEDLTSFARWSYHVHRPSPGRALTKEKSDDQQGQERLETVSRRGGDEGGNGVPRRHGRGRRRAGRHRPVASWQGARPA